MHHFVFNASLRRLLLVCVGLIAMLPATRASAADDPMSDDPEVERRLLQLPPGFEIQLYASEPAVINPVTINFDAQGRLWVLSLPSYPQVLPGQEGRDFITVLEGVDEKGRAKKSHAFASGLSVPTGLMPGDGGVYVGGGDSLVHLKDTDGDGVADQKRVLLTGFGTQDTHHTLNTFRWGPDGRLYFNQGVYILSSVETPFGLRRQFGGAMWQLRTDTLGLEIYDRSIYQSNTWGRIFDQWGRSLIASAWVADINLVLPDTPLNSSNDPEYVPPLAMTKIGGDRHSGLELISGRHFPAEWRDNLVSGGFQSQRVNRFALEDDGERLVAKQLEPLVVSKHRKFRPVDMKIGPDGALYVADWYDLIIQHNQVDFRDSRRDHERGRIWRITYKGRPLVTPPDMTAGTEKVLDYLKEPEQWTRDWARRTLAGRDRAEVKGALGKWVESVSSADANGEHELLEALWLHQSMETVEPALLKRLLNAKDARVRAAATDVLGYWHDRVEGSLTLLGERARDENIRVRLSAVLAAQRVPSAGAFEAAMNALEKPTDAMVEFELKKAALVLRPYWWPAFQAGKLTFNDDARRIAFALMAIKAPEGVPKLLELIESGKIPRERQGEVLAAVAGMGNAKQVVAVLDAAVTEDRLMAGDRARLLDALGEAARGRKVVPETDLARIAPLLKREDAVGTAAMRLAGAWKLEALRRDLKSIGEDSVISSQLRQVAMNALVELGGEDSRNYLTWLAASEKPFAIRADATVSLAGMDLKESTRLAARMFQENGQGDPGPVFAALLRRQGGPETLIEAMKEIKPSSDVAKIGLRELSAAGLSASPLAGVLRSAAEVATVRRKDSPEELKRLVGMVAGQGDPVRGERLFRSGTLGCMRCHAIAGGGGNVGPDLAAVGTSAQPDFLIEHILQPGKRVKDGYIALAVDTTTGESFTGVQLRETAETLVLRDSAHDEIVIPKRNIKKQRPIGTLMPNGLADGLTDGELCDLVRFLTELGKPGPFSVGHAAVARRWWTLDKVPFANNAGALGTRLAGDKNLPWSRQFANVAGEVPLSEVAMGPGKTVAILRCALDVKTAGKVSVALNSAEGVQMWVDGAPNEARLTVPLELTQGRHTLDFHVDLATRKSDTIRCELLEDSGSAARAQWAAN